MLVLVLASCASTPPDRIGGEATLAHAVARVGTLIEAERDGDGHAEREVMILKDRHSTTPGFHRLRPQLAQVQRANRMLVEYLVQHRGYSLLGCEQPLGVLADDERTAAQYRLIRRRLRYSDDLDGYSIFQPIRYQLLWGDRLEVFGVEDQRLYDEDLELFRLWVTTSRQARRSGITPEEREEKLGFVAATRLALSRNVIERGRAAADNLLALMEERGAKRAALLVGGAHVAAAAAVLRARGVPYRVFEPDGYRDEVDE